MLDDIWPVLRLQAARASLTLFRYADTIMSHGAIVPACTPRGSAEPVEPGRGAGEQRRLFGIRIAGGEAFERVPESVIAAAALIDREVALEHRALGAERVDAGIDVGAPCLGEVLRARRYRSGMEVEAEQAHAEAAEL